MFQEHINYLEGTLEFSGSIQKVMLPIPDQKSPEELYMLSKATLGPGPKPEEAQGEVAK